MKKHSSTKKFVLAAAIATTLASFAHAAPPIPTFTWDNLESSIDGVTYLTDSNLKDPWGLVPGEEAKSVWVANEATGTVTRYHLDGTKVEFVTGGTKKEPTFTQEVVNIPTATGTGTGTPTGIVYNHAAFLPVPASGVEFPQSYSEMVTTELNNDLVLDTDTAALVVGAPVSGTGIPNGATIKAVLNSGFVMSAKATASGATTATFTIPSRWLAVTEDGLVVGFNGGTVTSANVGNLVATVGFPNPVATSSNVYTGCTLAYTAGTGVSHHQLFAANFATGLIDAFNSDFTKGISFGLTTASTPTALPATPTGISTTIVPAGDTVAWKPYNVKRYATADKVVTGDTTGKKIERVLLVDYVLVDTTTGDVVPGDGYGFVAVYNTDGTFVTLLVDPVQAVTTDNNINTPWGMAIYRGGPRQAADALFVANQGNGAILSYSLANVFTTTNPNLNRAPSELKRPDGQDLRFAELHAIHFGLKPESINSYAADEDELDNGDGTLYFDADLFNQTRGLFGRIFAKPSL
jgi:hypothetical protein